MESYTDQEIVAQFLQTKNMECLTELFKRHSDLVYRTALRVMKNTSDADDIVQTVYCRIITKLHLYNNSGSFVGWMLKIVMHTCYNQLSSEKNRTKREKIIMSKQELFYSHTTNEKSEIIEKYLDKLPEIYRNPITLQILEGLTVKEVSEALQIPENTIRSQIARGLEKLRHSLQSAGFTLSIVAITEGIKAIPKVSSPELYKTTRFIQNSMAKKTSLSTTLAIAPKASSFFKTKLFASIFFVCIAVGVYFSQGKVLNAQTLNVPLKEKKTSLLKYTFEKEEDLSIFKIVSGSVAISPSKGMDTSKCLEIQHDSVLEIDISQFRLPIKLTFMSDYNYSDSNASFQGNIYAKDNFEDKKNIYGFYNITDKNTSKTYVFNKQELNQDSTEGYVGYWILLTLYISDEAIDIMERHNERGSIVLGKSKSNSKFYISCRTKTLIDNVTIEQVIDEDVPDYSQYAKYIAGMKYTQNPKSTKMKLDENISATFEVVEQSLFYKNINISTSYQAKPIQFK